MEIEKHLKENWNTYFPSLSCPQKFSLIFAKTRDHNSIFVFDEGAEFPICVVKVSTELTEKKLQNSFFAFKKLKSLNLLFLQEVYPHIFFFGELDGHEVIIQSFIKGQRMTKSVKGVRNSLWKKRFLSHISLVNKWLIEFHKNTKQNEELIDKIHASGLVDQIKIKLKSNSEISKDISKLYDDLEGKLFFNVFQHGDLHIDNVLIKDNGDIAVLDWDLSQIEGFPLWDILDFSIFYSRLILSGWGKGELPEYLPVTFFKNNSISKIISGAISGYIRDLGIDAQVAKILFLLWVGQRFNPQFLEFAFIHYEQFPFSTKIQQL